MSAFYFDALNLFNTPVGDSLSVRISASRGLKQASFFYSLNGHHHLVGGPFPQWVITTSITASVMMAIRWRRPP